MACPNCVSGGRLAGSPTGTMVQLDESKKVLPAYYAPAPMDVGNSTNRFAVVYLCDGFGLELGNCKIMADELANRLGCDVWVPDYFLGSPLVDINSFELIPHRAGMKMTVWRWIKFVFATLPRIPAFIKNRPAVVDARLTKFLNTLKEEKKYEKIGIVGYCYGGSTAVRLGGADLVQSVVVCHPGSFTIEEAMAIKIPTSWVCAEEDLFFSDALKLQTEEFFAGRKGGDDFVDYEFKTYKGTAHGFAARPVLSIPEIKEAYDGSLDQTVKWFKATLP